MREKYLVQQILTYLRYQGAWAIKLHGSCFSHYGAPDIVAIYRGYPLAIEVKSDSGKLSPAQAHHLSIVHTAHGLGFVIRDIETLKDIIETLKTLPERPIPQQIAEHHAKQQQEINNAQIS